MRKTLKRRRAMQVLAAAGSALGTPVRAQAAYPNRQVKFVGPFPPGQAADIFARLIAERLGELWKQQTIVDNKGGGAGIPGTESARLAPADGYTLLVATSGTFGVNPSL